MYFGSIKYVGTNWILHLNRQTCYLCYRRWVRFYQLVSWKYLWPKCNVSNAYYIRRFSYATRSTLIYGLFYSEILYLKWFRISLGRVPRFMWTNTPYLPAYSLFDQTNPSAARSLSLQWRNLPSNIIQATNEPESLCTMYFNIIIFSVLFGGHKIFYVFVLGSSQPREQPALHTVRSAYIHVVHEIREKFVMSFKWNAAAASSLSRPFLFRARGFLVFFFFRIQLGGVCVCVWVAVCARIV